MELMKTSVSGSAYAISSQSGVKRTTGSQVSLHLGVEDRQGVEGVVGRQGLVVAGVVAGVGVGAEAAADSRPTSSCGICASVATAILVSEVKVMLLAGRTWPFK